MSIAGRKIKLKERFSSIYAQYALDILMRC